MLGWIHRPATWLCAGTLGCQASPAMDGAAAPFELEVLSVATCEPEGPAPAPTGPGAPGQPGSVGVKVRVTGRFDGGVPANYYYASLVSQDGARYLAVSDGCKPLLSGPPLLPGESRIGYANFPLAAKKGAARLAYAPNLDHTRGATELSPTAAVVEAKLP